MIDVLERIASGIDATNARLDTLHEDVVALRAEVTSVKNEVSGLRVEVRADLDEQRHGFETRKSVFLQDAVPEKLAERVVALTNLAAGLDIVRIDETAHADVIEMGVGEKDGVESDAGLCRRTVEGFGFLPALKHSQVHKHVRIARLHEISRACDLAAASTADRDLHFLSA